MNEAIQSTQNVDLSGYSLEELNALVERAKKAITHKEHSRVQEVRSEIERLAGELNMTVEEVMGFDSRKKKGGKATGPGKVKFRNPANPGQTWTGRGKRPRWLQEAIDQGADLESFKA